jgi:D-beta-D-heptose 7-phosphate kinase/D-beta-D-heptose 1-phosphate adenosyltransferase
MAAWRGVPVLVDPARGADWSRYRGAALLLPNRAEAARASGLPCRSTQEALEAGRRLCERFGLPAVLVKLDRDGLALAEGAESGRCWPAWSRSARDVSGAGDAVLAMAGLCRAAGLDWKQAAALANVAAGIEVQKEGVAPVSRDEVLAELTPYNCSSAGKQVSAAQMASLAAGYRERGLRVVLTNGCFDLLHAGHVHCLEEAAGLGDVLVVAVNSDASVRRLKGLGRPVRPQEERAALLAALACVDHVVLFEEDTPHELLRRVRPDVLAKGGTYAEGEVVGREVVEGYGGRVCRTGVREGASTTALLAALRGPTACAYSYDGRGGVVNNRQQP